MSWLQPVKQSCRSICLLLMTLLILPSPSWSQTELFFSEYIEGTSNNKALEIFNGTGAAVDLAAGGYNVQMYFNGNTSAGLTINLTGIVANGDVFVLAQSSANATILAQADQTNGAGWYNGDDAVVLRKGTTIIDVIGQVGFDPGTEWGTGLTSTADNTLRRKSSITAGDTNPSDDFDPSVEWDGFATDTFDGLGSHLTSDVAPFVSSTTPNNGAGNVTINSDVIINFNEAVDVTGSWFTLSGSISGAHTATVSGGPQNFSLDPDVDFANSETVTVTVFAANVTDQDANDPPDNMATNFVFSFTTPGSVVTSPVRINEIDSDTPGIDALEFVELYDGGAGNTSLDGLIVVFYNGATDASYAAFELDGFTTNAAGFFLMGNTGVRPTPSIIFADNLLQNGADAVALYFGNASDFPNGTAVTTTNLIDAIVYGTSDPDDAGLLVLLNSGQPQVDEGSTGNSAIMANARVPDGGTARNTDNYVQQMHTPGTANVVREIWQIQGSGLASPFVNQFVATPNNVVTAKGSNGFTMQSPTAQTDNDPQTSDGIFVFTGSAPTVNVGDFVNVYGQVIEFFDFTEFSNNPIVTFVATGNPLPAPVVFDASTPSPNQPQPATEFERYEGMRIQISGGTVTGPNQFFASDPVAEVFIVAGPSRTFREPGIAFPGLPGLPVWDGNPEVFELDLDKLGLPNQIVPTGSSFDAVGVLGFEFGGYEFWPTEFSFTPATLPRNVRSRHSDEVTIGTLNLFRLFDNIDDPGSQDNGAVVSATEYARRLAKFSLYIRNVLKAPDILAVEEAEKLGVLQALANKIAADDPSIVYTAYLVEGNDVGGIDTGFLVRSNVQVDAVTQLGATETLSVDGSLLHDRPPLLLEGNFVVGSASSPITVMAVHNRSLNGIEDPGGGLRVRQKRLEQAQSIAQKAQDLQTSNPNVRLVVIGDFNAYQFTDGYVDAVGQIAGNFNPSDNLLSGPDLVNPDLAKQVLSLSAEEQYSFIFDGSAQVLDHILTSQAIKPTGLQYGRGNADAAENFINDATTPLRSSDHDGLVMYLDIVPPSITVAGSPARLWPADHNYHTFSITDFVSSVTDGSTTGLSLADVFIVSATSDEAENGDDDGNTFNDIVIIDCQTVQLRAERSGIGNGRVYNVNVAAQDESGNLGTASFQIYVPLNQSDGSAIDDGPAYTVSSGCSALNAAKALAASGNSNQEVTSVPAEYVLVQNYPNPFNPETEIRFQLPQASHVVLKIFNTLGREILTLTDGQYQAGYHRIRWNGKDANGNPLASGVYLYQLRAGGFSQVRKMSLLR